MLPWIDSLRVLGEEQQKRVYAPLRIAKLSRNKQLTQLVGQWSTLVREADRISVFRHISGFAHDVGAGLKGRSSKIDLLLRLAAENASGEL